MGAGIDARITGRQRVALFLLAIVLAPGLADAAPDKTRVLLIGEPDTTSKEPIPEADVIRSSLERGAQEGVRQGNMYGRAVSLREIGSDRTHFVDPVRKFGDFTAQQLLKAMRAKYKRDAQLELSALLYFSVWRMSTGQVVVDFEVWELPTWKVIAQKSIGGCGTGVEELAEQAREIGVALASGQNTNTQPHVRADLSPIRRRRNGVFHVLTGETITLDSCSTFDKERDAFFVRWEQPACAKPGAAGCVLPSGSVRRRQTVDLVKAGKYEFRLTAEPALAGALSTAVPGDSVTVVAIDPPKAVPVMTIDDVTLDSFDPDAAFSVAQFEASNQPAPISWKKTAVQSTPLDLPEAREPAPDEEEEEEDHPNEGVRIVRINPGLPRHITLDGSHSHPSDSARWKQVEGPRVELDDEPVQRFPVTWNEPGYYAFTLTAKNKEYTDVRRVEFFVAPETQADAGPPRNVIVGDEVELDGHGTYDALDASPLYSWSVEPEWSCNDRVNPSPSSDVRVTARILNPHSRTPTFKATEPGRYGVRVFVRARRNYDDRKLWEVATDCTVVEAVRREYYVRGGMQGISGVQEAEGRFAAVGQVGRRFAVGNGTGSLNATGSYGDEGFDHLVGMVQFDAGYSFHQRIDFLETYLGVLKPIDEKGFGMAVGYRFHVRPPGRISVVLDVGAAFMWGENQDAQRVLDRSLRARLMFGWLF